jgi:hypothetical protein
MVVYRFEDSRAGECVARHLNGYRGILQVDGYAAYDKLVRSDRGNDGVTLAGCWSHGRRKFYELHVAESSKVATETVERMATLWQFEETVRGQSPEARVAARQQTSAAVVAELFALWQQTLPRISGKSKLAEALRYAISRRAMFASWQTAASSSTPTSSSEQSDPRPSRERTHSSPAATAAEGAGRPSPRFCRRQR